MRHGRKTLGFATMLPNVGAALERLTAFFQASDMPRRVAPGKPWPCSDKPRSEEPRPQGHGEGAAVAEQGQGAAVAALGRVGGVRYEHWGTE